ncbi:MAG: methyltransferase domain-containing protein [Thermoleophilia bacterium]|nr:methyltransferase domain-containing protein [Thermoleophilia bacterium]
MNELPGDQIESWRSVAEGWARQREALWRATRALSERMVELLDPRPGERVLELAAGSGDTGFLAAARLGPEGRLLSTDAAPEMVAAAARRAEELGLTNVELSVVDAAATGLPGASVDGALCRFGVMLVPDCDAAARELARVVRPGGRVVLAVWAEARGNPWLSAVGRAALELGLIERPTPDEPGPFRLADPGRLRRLVEEAGLRVDVLEDAEVTWRAASLDEWWAIAQDTSQLVRTLAARLGEAGLATLREHAAGGLRAHARPDGSLVVPGKARVVLAGRG